MNEPDPPDLDFCSRCYEHTEFEWDDVDEIWLSACCAAMPINVD